MGREGQPARPVTGRDVFRWAAPYLGVLAICVLIWLITSLAAGHRTYFWPVWMLIPLAAGVLGQWATRGNR